MVIKIRILIRIALANLKRKSGCKAEAKVIGPINRETKFVLDYFKVDTPSYLNDVKVKIKDVSYTKKVLTCDIHTRVRTKRILKENGALTVYGLDEIMNSPINGSGYNPKYGLLGSNKSTEEVVKLFPRDPQKVVNEIKEKLAKYTQMKEQITERLAQLK